VGVSIKRAQLMRQRKNTRQARRVFGRCRGPQPPISKMFRFEVDLI